MFKLLLLALVAVTPAYADTVTFAARAAFQAAGGPLQSQSFNSCTARTLAFAGPLDAAYTGAACPTGAISPGLSFADTGSGGSGLYIAARGYAGNHVIAIGQNNRAADALTLNFAGGTHAIGFDVFQNFGGGAQLGHAAPFDIQLWSGTTLLTDFTLTVPSGRSAFFGAVSSATAITRVAIDNSLAYDLVGNIVFSRQVSHAAALVPEPAPFALLCFASATLFTLRRR